MRACTTEPSIITSSIANHATMGVSSVSGDGTISAMSGRSSPHGYRRATDLLNRVAYLSSCAASSAHYGSNSMDPRAGQRRSPLSHVATAAATSGGHSSRGAAVAVSARSSSEGANACRRSSSECDDVFGSSPASTNTGASLDDDLHSHMYSAKYFSFPSFDTWDPDNQYKEDEDGKIP